MTKIYAPNAAYNGHIAGVAFADGVADVDEKQHAAAMGYFRRRGFGIGKAVERSQAAAGAPAKSASKAAWIEFAQAQGASDADLANLSKDQIVEKYGGTKAPARVDARDASVPIGGRLRDAAVDPSPDDFLAPVNAGQADPHGPLVVSPEIHASGPAGIKPGNVHVDDTDAQDAAESALAESVLIEGEEHPSQPDPDPDGEQDVDRGPLGLSDPGSVEMGKSGAMPARSSSVASWRTWAIAQGMDPDDAGTATRAELIERYGSEG